MATPSIDYTGLYRADLPPAAAPWSGFPRFNFVGGHNDADSVPVDDLVAAASSAIAREGRTLATYGLNSGSLGYRPLREFIAAKLARDAGIDCTPDEVLVTSGSLQGLDLVNQILLEPGDTVIMEHMTYGGAITRVRRLGVNVVGVPVDHDGIVIPSLVAILDDLAGRGIRPKYLYTIPTVQNPTATVMSRARREALLALTTARGLPIFEDECYADLIWDGKRPQSLRGMAGDDRVIHIGSFSKSIAPALRLGFLVASWPVMSRILGIKNDGGSGALEQMIVAEYCREHFDSHLGMLRSRLHAKLNALMAALREQFGAMAAFEPPVGGIFLWVSLPAQVDTSRLAQVALQAGIAINPGAEWMTDASAGKQRLRLCFAHPSVTMIREGVAALAEVCRQEFGVPPAPGAIHR